MGGENPQRKNLGKALLRPRAGNGSPDTRRYRGRVRINRIRIQVEPRTILFALSHLSAQGVFSFPEPKSNKKGDFDMKNSEKTMEKIVALCKGRGFVFSGSEIYGEPLQRGSGRRHPDESSGLGGFRSRRRLLRPSDGL